MAKYDDTSSIYHHSNNDYNITYLNDLSEFSYISTKQIAAYKDTNNVKHDITIGASSNVNIEAAYNANIYFNSNDAVVLYNYDVSSGIRNNNEILRIQHTIDTTLIEASNSKLKISGMDSNNTTILCDTTFFQENNFQIFNTIQTSGFKVENPMYIASNLTVADNIIGFSNLAIYGNSFAQTMNIYNSNVGGSQIAYSFYINEYDQLELLKYTAYTNAQHVSSSTIGRVATFAKGNDSSKTADPNDYRVMNQFNGLYGTAGGHIPGQNSIQWTTVGANSSDIFYTDGNVGVGVRYPTSRLHVVGDFTIAGDIIPATDGLYSLGSSTKRFKDIYVSANTIHIGDSGSIGVDPVTNDPCFFNQSGAVITPGVPNIFTKDSNVGICIENPLYTLDVAGPVNAYGYCNLIVQDIIANSNDQYHVPSVAAFYTYVDSNVKSLYDGFVYDSNLAIWASNAGTYGSNTAFYSSNFLYNTVIPKIAYGSNTAYAISNLVNNTVIPEAAYGSNTAYAISNLVNNTVIPEAAYGSNTANWSSNNMFNKAGGTISGAVTVNNDLTVTGNLLVNGDTSYINMQTLQVDSNQIILNYGESTGPFQVQSGIVVNRGTEASYNILYDESSKTLQAGFTGSVQKVPTLCNNVSANGYTYYNTDTNSLTLDNTILDIANYGSNTANNTSNLVHQTVIPQAAYGSNLAVTNSNTLYPQAAFGSNSGAFGSNLAVTSSNTLYPQAAYGSNLAVTSSNALYPQAAYGSNLAVTSSNALYPQAGFGSNAGAFGSNLAVTSSNTLYSQATYGSNLAVTSSNALYPQAAFGSNAGAFGSNLAVTSSNTLYPQAAYGSNLAVTNSNTLYPRAAYGSNLAVTSSNTLYPQAAYGSNTASWSSNNMFNKAGGTIYGPIMVSNNLSFKPHSGLNNQMLNIYNTTNNSLLLGVTDTVGTNTNIGDSLVQSSCNLVLTGTSVQSTNNILTTANSPINSISLFYANQLSLTSGSLVSSWGNFTQSTTANQPTYQSSGGGTNNYPYVSFNSTNNNYLQSPSSITYNIATNGGFTYIAYIRINSSQTYPRIFTTNNISIIQSGTSLMFGTNTISPSFNVTTSSGVISIGNWQIITCRYNASTNIATIYNGLTQVGTTNTIGAATNITQSYNLIAKSLNGDPYGNMDIAYMALYDSFITDSTLSTLVNQLNTPYINTNIYNNLVITGTNTYTSGSITAPNITATSNLAIWSSNAGSYASNLSVTSSNTLYPQAAYGSNLAVTSSNTLYPQTLFGSNAGAFGSNLAVTSSNTLYPQAAYGSNLAVTSSNTLYPQAAYGSNTAVWASNNMFNKAGGAISGAVIVNNDLTVTGNLLVNGDSSYINMQTLQVDSNQIILNYGESTSPFQVQSGIVVNRGTESSYNMLYDEPSKKFKIGYDGALEQVPTICNNSMTNGYAYYNASTNSFSNHTLISQEINFNSNIALVNNGISGYLYTSNANIGIGTANPITPLDVNGASTFRNTVSLSNSTGIVPLSNNANSLAVTGGIIASGTVNCTDITSTSINTNTGAISGGLVTANAGINVYNGLTIFPGLGSGAGESTITNIQGFSNASTGVVISTGLGSNIQMKIGGSTIGTFSSLGLTLPNGTSSILAPSDERVKNNIISADIDTCYKNIQNLPLRNFTWSESNMPGFGWIAQEVQSVIPDAVKMDVNSIYNIDDFLYIDSDKIIKNLYGSVQKLMSIVEQQQIDIENLKNK